MVCFSLPIFMLIGKIFLLGHDRHDVTEYRNRKFVPTLLKYCKSENVVIIFHDETTFFSNEAGNRHWRPQDVRMVKIKPKSPGQVNGFLFYKII